jgi:hypothetical protein
LIAGALVFAAPEARAAEQAQVAVRKEGVRVVKFDVSPPLRSLPQTVAMAPPEYLREIKDDPREPLGAYGPQDADGALQDWTVPFGIPGPSASFNGPANLSGVQPPDPVGDVGPDRIVVMSNLNYAIYNKSGGLEHGPLANNSLWAGFGGPCQNENAGDPVVLHDQLADRWLLTQFTSNGPTYFNCVALSTTSDPEGSYFRYQIANGTNFPDYPKWGVWPDAYYLSTRDFGAGPQVGVGAFAINRAEMLAGDPTPGIVSFFVPNGATRYNIGDGLLPSDLDGFTLPPAGAPNVYVGAMDDGATYGAPQDALTLWEFHVDWTTPANSTFTLAATLPIAPYDTIYGTATCTGPTRQCIPQPGTANRIDILSYRQRPLHRAAYRNFGTHQALVTNQSVEAQSAPQVAGFRWWEIRDPAGTPVLFQEGTFAPGITDGVHRWMGSAAMDSAGNLAVSYSASDGTSTFPSVWYTGRLASDPPGTLPQGEGSIVDGLGSQTSGGRWGDYTSLNVDPANDCTFWAVNEWLPASGGNWTLRIGAFEFVECGVPNFSIAVDPPTQAVCAPDNAVYDVDLGSILGFSDPITLSAAGNPAGTSVAFVPNPVTPPATSVMTVSGTGAAPGGTSVISVTGTSGALTHSADAELEIVAGEPAAPALVSPPDGATGVSFSPTLTWSATAGADAYFVEVDDDAGFGSPVFTDTLDGLSTQVTGLDFETQYFWRVTASNICGDGAASAVFDFTTQLTPGTCGPEGVATLAYSYGFEAGASGWTSSGSNNSWAISNTRSHSGTFSQRGQDLASVSDQRLLSPAIVLPGAGESPIALRYWNHQTFEDEPPGCADGAILEISTDGGTTFTQLTGGALLTDPYDGTVTPGGGNPLQTLQAWCADPQDWFESIVDLDAYAGQTVRFRFRIGTDTTVGRSPDGWFVDDVVVQSCVGMPFLDGFETGNTIRWTSTVP